MKALSLLQPWAGLLALGIKEYETRSRNTHFRGTIAIHASARMTKEGKELLAWLAKNRFAFKPSEHKYQICTTLGAVLGTVDITDSWSTDMPFLPNGDEARFGNYDPGRFFYRCENPVLFNKPIPAKGALGIWTWDPEMIHAL